jgi:transposase
MRNIKDVLRLKYVGKLSHERIAVALGISKGVVTKYAGLANAAGLNWQLVQPMDEAQLHNRLINSAPPQSTFVLPDYGLIHQELRRKGMTLMLLWEEHVEQYGKEQTHRYAQFCVHYRQYAKSLKRTMRQVHRAGEKLFIDFAGSTVGLRGGERAHIFVAALGASSYTFAYATPRETMADWLGATARALTFFGGVPQSSYPTTPRP